MLQSHQMNENALGAAGPRPVSGVCSRKGPLVTVLIPTYNRRRSLPRALASVVQQNYRELEIIVVRDGGQDVCDIVRSFRDPRLVFIDRAENRGKPHSLNEALSRATGKYVAYLDDDDIYYETHVEALVNALEGQSDCQVAYSDLYKTYCWERPDGSRPILSKYVEICRDFDRPLMMYFNHVLHVSLMHRRDLLEKTGPYNEQLNILIDWDMTRRLAFFSDFRHVPVVTGEFYSPVGECDRISIQRRKDKREYIRNVMAIRNTRPAKPWPKMEDLSIIVLADRLDQVFGDTLRDIWRNTFHPYQVYLPLPPVDKARLKMDMPNAVWVPVRESSSLEERLDAALQQAEGSYVAIVPRGIPMREMWVENPLYAMMRNPAPSKAFLLEGATSSFWGAVLRREDLLACRRRQPLLTIEASLAAGGICAQRPDPEDLPFQFDEGLRQAKLAEADGDWLFAAQAYETMAKRHYNQFWMRAMAARAYFNAGRYPLAMQLSRQINDERPTIDTLLLEAKVCRRGGNLHQAIQLLTDAEQRLQEQVVEPPLTATRSALV